MEEKVTLFISEDGQDKKVICEAQFSERGVTLGPLSPDEQHSVNGPWQFSWDQLKLYLGGAYEKLLFFEFAGTPEGSFYIEASRGHLKSLGKIQNPTLSEKLSPILTKKLRSTGLFYGTIFSLFFALGLLWVSRGAIAEKLTAFVPYSVEQKLGGKILSVMLPEMSRYADENVKKELDNLLAPVLKVLDHPEDYQFYISRSGELNAFALPGGIIVINKGLIDHADRPEEVLGVVAHELGHAYERHVLKNIIQASGAFIVLSLFLGDVEGIIGVLADQGSFLMSRKFSRDFERMADDFAYDHLSESMIDPGGMADFFEKIIKKEKQIMKDGEKISKALSFMSTHPDTESRIQNIRKKIAESGIQYKPVEYDLNQLKNILK